MISNLTDAEFVNLYGALDAERSERVVTQLARVPDFLNAAICEALKLGDHGAALAEMLDQIIATLSKDALE